MVSRGSGVLEKRRCLPNSTKLRVVAIAKDPKTGKMIPAFAMDGKGKMAKGGMTKKKKGYAKGGMMKKKGMARGGMKKGYAARGMTVPQLRAAAKAKGYKIMKG